jgi:proline utilization trans-activator
MRLVGFLGPSSTWAYSQQVMRLIKDHLKHSESPEVPLNQDGQALSAEWPSGRANGPLSMDQIPSLDYAMYLINTVKFHLGQLYHLFHEKTFMDGLYEFYDRGPQIEPLPGRHLWFVHFLLIMGFGQALLSGSVGKRPGGSELISRAVELLPNSFGLYQDPILSIEILCCLALYLQSIDHRNSAFLYVSNPLGLSTVPDTNLM